MNEVEYFTLDVYDQKELEATLRFAPYLHYKLFSIQDVYSRTDTYKFSSYGSKNDPSVMNKSWSGSFSEAVNSTKPVDYGSDANGNTETHIVAYSKVVFERDPSFAGRDTILPIEYQWRKMGELLRRIAKKAEEADLGENEVNTQKGHGGGLLTCGLIIFSISLIALGFGLYLNLTKVEPVAKDSIYAFAPFILGGGGGLCFLGLLFAIIGICGLAHGSSFKGKCRKTMKLCVSDYRLVRDNKRAFESTVMKGYSPNLDAKWLETLCEIYGVSYTKPRVLKKVQK